MCVQDLKLKVAQLDQRDQERERVRARRVGVDEYLTSSDLLDVAGTRSAADMAAPATTAAETAAASAAADRNLLLEDVRVLLEEARAEHMRARQAAVKTAAELEVKCFPPPPPTPSTVRPPLSHLTNYPSITTFYSTVISSENTPPAIHQSLHLTAASIFD